MAGPARMRLFDQVVAGVNIRAFGALLAILWLALSAGGAAASQSDQAATLQPGTIGREPYVFPLNRTEWLAFIGATPAGRAAADDYAALVSEADYERYRTGERTRTWRIRYRSGDLTINGFMVEPRATGGGPFPVIIFNHGGVMEAGRITLADLLEFNRIAERGYVVVASTYRGEGGSEGRPSMDGGDVDDVLALIDALPSIPTADPTRIGMWGASRGGFVTYSVLARTARVQAVVIHAGPTDLVNAPRRPEFDRHVYPHVIRDYARNRTAALTRLSPIRWPERLAADTSILLIHGGDDPRVPATDSLRMATELQRLQRAYRMVLIEGGSHELLPDYREVRRELDRWFDLYVRQRQPARPNGITALPMEP